ncbi:hypothetical protein B566_EDAN007929 [Ephemera danica]|nr:hypothetical protein B566_EDAN007929 [Ephemera danica]
MNNIFFNGKQVFPESSEQNSCTIGVHAAYSPGEQVICLDTEGLLGATTKEKTRYRLLLKVLAISDLVIYRTKAERIHKDLYTFLGEASNAYVKHFASALAKVGRESSDQQMEQDSSTACILGPAVMIFHETRHTNPLQNSIGDNIAELELRQMFAEQNYDLRAFSSLGYVGQRTTFGNTDFTKLKAAVHDELRNKSVRSPRLPKHVLSALSTLNNKFNKDLVDSFQPFPAEYFSCPATCASCRERCEHSMDHVVQKTPHTCDKLCIFQHQYQNCEYLCTTCYNSGHRQIVVPKMAAANEQSSWLGIAKYAWSGYVLECKRCGVIYRSRQYWYGNKDPDQTVVRAEVIHIWENERIGTTGHNTARRMLDGVTQISEAVASVGSVPSKAFASWVADQINPKYWVPNSEIVKCHNCRESFASDDTKHHCRACGKGFCEACSSYSRPVPERGWGPTPVRVCKICHNPHNNDVATTSHGDESLGGGEEIRARKYGEAVINTLSSVASVVIDYPKELIKDSMRPDYWIPDADIHECCSCKTPLPTSKQRAHHCRDCGQGVCHSCSGNRKPVPRRGWDTPVRVCNNCFKKQD